MIVCPNCNNESADDALFCGFCGGKLATDGDKKTLFGLSAVPRQALAPAGGTQPPAAAEPVPPAALTPAAAVTKHTEPAPEPRRVEPAPEPLRVEAAPEPLRVEPAPEPRRVEPAPEPLRVEPAPEPRRVEPTPQPTPAAQLHAPAPATPTPRGSREPGPAPRAATPDFPAPALPKNAEKADEEEFFGTTLSRYGLAPVQPTRGVDKDLKVASRNSILLLLSGFIVLAMIVGAIAYLILTRSE